VGLYYILIYNFEQLKLYLVNIKNLEICKCMVVKDIGLMSMSDDGVAYLSRKQAA
jgi:hypothetical protein